MHKERNPWLAMDTVLVNWRVRGEGREREAEGDGIVNGIRH